MLPVKNGATYLAASIDSILQQSLTDWRLFVLDHGSEDASVEIASRYAQLDSRVVVLSYPNAEGLSGLLNLGLKRCDAKFLARQDADDISSRDRLKHIAEAFEQDQELVAVGSFMRVMNSVGEFIGRIELPVEPDAVQARALFQTPMAHPTVAMRLSSVHDLSIQYGKDFIRAVPQGERLYVPGLAEDYFLFGQLALFARCRNIPLPLVDFRVHDGSVTSTKFIDQMQIALRVSRYLARTLTLIHGTRMFDPGPFCTHGGMLFRIADVSSLDAEFEEMTHVIVDVMGRSVALDRELAFRSLLRDRSLIRILLSFAKFASKHGACTSELQMLRGWLTATMRRRKLPVLST